ncbi:NAD-dependent epimerase [Synechococcus sp. CS-602]|uniref:NAD-dependent epimerase n=1 Tax=Synechococcaceae TaxID=1890426 RepID=UPI0008FF113D|nr:MULTISPECIES: NAD-dependent epimerase [Synechococcaceae]MCT4364639.1 NAD-dependent epimerase [Candidatus Regnicoccus frigidus MAG-AL1]APD47777.1 capsular biosynthesis protein CpsI [Synechococcus sp. SynAce01]MCT0202846.1 NAD-dependent epimerase [Synechococcus sp. CS-603]MCT0204836.1 NAD-dependent epimerase [Synechococcus sp. CS-602]MCT0245072.1 NAD-dependent epimerase [Synechococcus sp. CS-601]
MSILVTGAAGFIGAAVAERLLARGDRVIGLDNLNSYYSPALKQQRLQRLERHSNFHFQRLALEDTAAISELFRSEGLKRVIHLAAQAGVRYSIENPLAYVNSNVVGFLSILEGCRHHGIEHLVYASSSSVYGGNRCLPFSEQQAVNHPVSLYAATKKANELMAHTYSHLYGLPATGLRFFTVYGPWGRPDMAPMLFAKAILSGEPIRVFNQGRMERDFTYIDDIVEGVLRCLDKPATAEEGFDPLQPNPATAQVPHRLFNIGNSQPVPLLSFIALLEQALGVKAIPQWEPMQPGDVVATAADTTALQQWVGFAPHTPLEVGVERFASWYLNWAQAEPTAT